MLRTAVGGSFSLLIVAGMTAMAAEHPQVPTPSGPPLMEWKDLLSRPRPEASTRLAYGGESQQFGDLWLPDKAQGARLILMIHGGCWTKSIASLQIMNYAAEDLRRRGFAVWNIEYRGIDEAGGGYPGTYLDVAAGIDAARQIAATHHLDLHRPIIIGHSAGGHLALWAAGRGGLAPDSPLYSVAPLRIWSVIDLAGLANLQTDTATACGPEPVAAMAGPSTADRADIYADTSPAALVPLHAAQYVIHGLQDTTVAPGVGDAYAALARAAGDHVEVSNPPGGHVEEIAPDTASWNATAALVQRLAAQ